MALSPFYSSESPPGRKPNQGRGEEILQFRFQPCPKTTSKVQVGTPGTSPRPGCEWARTKLWREGSWEAKSPKRSHSPQEVASLAGGRGRGGGAGTLPRNHLATWEHLLVARPRPGEVPRGSGGTLRPQEGSRAAHYCQPGAPWNRDTERNPLCLLVQEECPWGSVSSGWP